jgi:predicted RNA-binding Zn-ribbon protein involved in translation (DUF1610 family)
MGKEIVWKCTGLAGRQFVAENTIGSVILTMGVERGGRQTGWVLYMDARIGGGTIQLNTLDAAAAKEAAAREYAAALVAELAAFGLEDEAAAVRVGDCPACGHSLELIKFANDTGAKITCPDCGWRIGEPLVK